MDFDRLNADALGRAESLLQSWFPHGRRAGREFRVGDLSGNPGKSLSINLHSGVWCDFSSGEKGSGLIRLLMAKERMSPMAAAQRLAQEIGHHRAGKPTTRGASPRPRTPHPLKPIVPSDFGDGSIEDLNRLRITRHLPTWNGAYYALRRGLLGFATTKDDGKPVKIWCLTDGERRVAQWRRLDGKPWQGLPGQPKAKTLVRQPGEAGWPVGLADAKNRKLILLCEGGPDLLTALELLWLTFPEDSAAISGVGVTTMLGASQSLHTEALPYLKNKHIRIVYHDDEAGKRSCVRLATTLTKAGAARVDAFRINGLTLSPDGKDLNDCVSNDPFNPHHKKLSQLFHS